MLDLNTLEYPHGTDGGYGLGCRGSNCFGQPITCETAHMRYAGDWVFRKRTDAGMTPAQIATAEHEDATLARNARHAAKMRDRRAHAPKKVHTLKPFTPPKRTAAHHGTATGYKQLNCRDNCPETYTCRMASTAERMKYKMNGKATPSRVQDMTEPPY